MFARGFSTTTGSPKLRAAGCGGWGGLVVVIGTSLSSELRLGRARAVDRARFSCVKSTDRNIAKSVILRTKIAFSRGSPLVFD